MTTMMMTDAPTYTKPCGDCGAWHCPDCGTYQLEPPAEPRPPASALEFEYDRGHFDGFEAGDKEGYQRGYQEGYAAARAFYRGY